MYHFAKKIFKRQSVNYHCAGFSFLELMLAAALGTIVLICFSQVYLGSKEIYKKQTSISQLQNDVNFASEILTKNIRMAGYAGCGKIRTILAEKHYTLHQPLAFIPNWEKSVYGFSAADAPAYLSDKIAANTDAIVIQKADADTTKLACDVKAPTSTIKVMHNPATINNKILLLADCDHADLFQTKNRRNSLIHIQGNSKIHHDYSQRDSEINRFTELTYFISNTSRLDAHGKPIFGLYVITNRGNKEELLSNVNNMQIEYGVVKNDRGAIERYYKALDVSAHDLWNAVRSVIIDLDFVGPRGKIKKLQLYINLRQL